MGRIVGGKFGITEIIIGSIGSGKSGGTKIGDDSGSGNGTGTGTGNGIEISIKSISDAPLLSILEIVNFSKPENPVLA